MSRLYGFLSNVVERPIGSKNRTKKKESSTVSFLDSLFFTVYIIPSFSFFRIITVLYRMGKLLPGQSRTHVVLATAGSTWCARRAADTSRADR